MQLVAKSQAKHYNKGSCLFLGWNPTHVLERCRRRKLGRAGAGIHPRGLGHRPQGEEDLLVPSEKQLDRIRRPRNWTRENLSSVKVELK